MEIEMHTETEIRVWRFVALALGICSVILLFNLINNYQQHQERLVDFAVTKRKLEKEHIERLEYSNKLLMELVERCHKGDRK